MNKMKKNIFKIVIILVVLLLVVVTFLVKGRNQTPTTKKPSTEEIGEFVVKTEQDTTEETGDSDNFLNETTSQKQETDAGKKGGSETLNIISSENATDRNEDDGNKELIWLPDVW